MKTSYKHFKKWALWSSVLLFSSSLFALEGGSTSSSPGWSSVAAPKQPSASERQQELAARQKAIQMEIAKLKKRLQNQPSAANTQKLHGELKKVIENYGWSPELELVFGIRATEPILNGQDQLPPELLQAFIQLREDLAARGADLIVVPLAPHPQVASHLLVNGINPEHEFSPGWTKMMLQFLENDIEIVDTTEEFRKQAANDMLVNWVNDFHTGSMGRQIAASAVAERLQRYAFARELVPNRKKWSAKSGSKVGCHFPQRNYVVNRAFAKVNKDKIPAGAKSWKVKHPRQAMILKSGAPDIEKDVKSRRFQYMDLSFSGNKDSLRRNEVVFIGDSQLHSAVYGSGLPEFYNAAIGGNFRWGSKSWGGFSLPEIYLDVVPDSATQPRVVVASFLPKYFWTKIDRRSGKPQKTKYGPKPMPPYKGAKSTAVAAAPAGAVEATVRITKVSKKPTEDPTTLDYDEALMHVAAQVTSGPLRGKEIGLRYWILKEGAWTKANRKVRVGQTLKLTLIPFGEATTKDRKLGQHQVFDDTNQDLMIPVYWPTKGPLAPGSVL